MYSLFLFIKIFLQQSSKIVRIEVKNNLYKSNKYKWSMIIKIWQTNWSKVTFYGLNSHKIILCTI